MNKRCTKYPPRLAPRNPGRTSTPSSIDERALTCEGEKNQVSFNVSQRARARGRTPGETMLGVEPTTPAYHYAKGRTHKCWSKRVLVWRKLGHWCEGQPVSLSDHFISSRLHTIMQPPSSWMRSAIHEWFLHASTCMSRCRLLRGS